jgi:hypothetical protein
LSTHQILVMDEIRLLEGRSANRTAEIGDAPLVDTNFMEAMAANSRPYVLILFVLCQAH